MPAQAGQAVLIEHIFRLRSFADFCARFADFCARFAGYCTRLRDAFFFNLPLVCFILHFSAGNRLHQTSSRTLKESNQAYLVTCLILYVLYHVLVWLLLILSSCKWYPQCKIALSPLFLQDVQDMHITYHFQSELPQSPRSRATWTKPTIPRSNIFCKRFNKQLNKRYHFPKKGIKITFAHYFL